MVEVATTLEAVLEGGAAVVLRGVVVEGTCAGVVSSGSPGDAVVLLTKCNTL